MTTTLLTLKDRLQKKIGDTNNTHADKYTDVINDAARELYPVLFRKFRDQTLVMGNILPNASFEDWTVSTVPDFFTTSTGTDSETTTAGTYRGPRGTSALKVIASGANDKCYITSNTYPKLLDVMNQTIDFCCWAYPEVADDSTITIYTVKADGTAQTLTSTTSCPALKWTLIKLESQTINDDLVEIQFRFNVATSTKYVIFDSARVLGKSIREYLIPKDLQSGVLKQVKCQTSGYSDDICDDLHASGNFQFVHGWSIVDDGTYKFLRLPSYSSGRSLELIGIAPLEDTLDADTETMTIEDPYTNLLITYAAYLLNERLAGIGGSDSTVKYDIEADKWYRKFRALKLSGLRMIPPAQQFFINTP